MTMSGTFEEDRFGMETEDSGDTLYVSMGEVDDSGFKPVPRGLYDVALSQLDFGFSQRSNNPMWTWVWEVEEGEYANRKFFYHTVFNEQGMPRVKRTLARIKTDDGYEAELLAAPRFSPENVANEGRLLGARARLRIDIRKYEGQPRNNVRDVLPPQATGAESGGFAGV
jgi:hypothetical protein